MNDYDMYVLLRKKSLNIKMHMNPEDVAEIAERFVEPAMADANQIQRLKKNAELWKKLDSTTNDERKNRMKRYVHGIFTYDCVNDECGERRYMYLEQGLEEQCNPKLKKPSGKPHKPTPFIIGCPKCGGRMQHVGDIWFDDFVEAKKGIDMFMNVKRSDCGKPRFNWGGE